MAHPTPASEAADPVSGAARRGFALSHRAGRQHEQPISWLMRLALDRPDLISLAAGFVDDATLPVDVVRRSMDDLLGDPARGRAALQYGTTIGAPDLRRAVFDHLAALDGVTPGDFPGGVEDVILTSGSQQALHMLADALLDPGDIVIAGWPSYFVYTSALDAFGATVRGVDRDDEGMIPAALRRRLEELAASGELSRVKMLYVVTDHQNPTGMCLGTERRAELLDIIGGYEPRVGHRILIVEDAAYRELGAPGAPPKPSIRGLDPTGLRVAYVGTFSKPFSPGLRTGYALLPHELVAPVLADKGGRDFGSSNFTQAVIAHALTGGGYAAHVTALRAAYAAKRVAMLDALASCFAGIEGVHWTHPTGGLYVWLTLPEGIDTGKDGRLLPAAMERGMLYVPGAMCFPRHPTRDVPRNCIRLSFGVAGEARIAEGIAMLAAAVRDVLASA